MRQEQKKSERVWDEYHLAQSVYSYSCWAFPQLLYPMYRIAGNFRMDLIFAHEPNDEN